jgi:hypothetical protein
VRIHLIPLGRSRFEPYAEPPATDDRPPGHEAGRVRRWLHRASEQWGSLVDAARLSSATSGFARWRDRVICGLAESLDEQRTLWSLRNAVRATLLFPSNIERPEARRLLDQILAAAQRHHGQRLVIYLVLFAISGVLFFVPGPNIVAYYFGFRTFGHLQSWRGARRALTGVQWTLQPSDDLAELATLVEQPHSSRAARVEDIARRLDLEHLPAFFERAAA